jgi:hypothetical protein
MNGGSGRFYGCWTAECIVGSDAYTPTASKAAQLFEIVEVEVDDCAFVAWRLDELAGELWHLVTLE